MKICVFYSSPKLGDIFLQLPFIKAISEKYKTKVTICINKHLNIKKILKEQDYIDDVIENYFRRGSFFLLDLYKLSSELRNKNFDYALILEKTKGPALACKLAKIKKIYGFGIGSQKYFVNRKVRLNKNDLRFNYTKQSKKFLHQMNIYVNFDKKFLNLKNIDNKIFYQKFEKLPKPWVCFGVDSSETNRIWPQKYFSLLADKLIDKKFAKTIFVINSQDHENYFENIVLNSKNQKSFVDCKKFNRDEIINIIDFCEYFVGIDSGPSCVAGALQKNTFCIFGATDATLPQFKSMIKIRSIHYTKDREIGIKRCGDNFAKDNSEVMTIKVNDVYDIIKSKLKKNIN